MRKPIETISVSSINDFQNDRLRWCYKWVENRVPRVTPSALTGSLVHWQTTSRGSGPMAGAMMPQASETVRRSWPTGEARVEAASWRASGTRLATFQVLGGEARLEVKYDPRHLTLKAIGQAEPEAGRVASEPGKLLILGPVGSEFTVQWEEADGAGSDPIVTVTADGIVGGGTLPAGVSK